MKYMNMFAKKSLGGNFAKHICKSRKLRNFAENMLCDKSSSHSVSLSPRQKRQQLRRAEALVRNRLAVKQPTA